LTRKIDSSSLNLMVQFKLNERGALNLLTIVSLVIVGVLAITANIPVTRNYPQNDLQVLGASTNTQANLIADQGQTAVVEGQTGALITSGVNLKTPSDLKVLPEKAVGDTLASKIMDEVNSVRVTGSLASVNRMVKLENTNSGLVYKVKGYKKQKLLGVIPVKNTLEAVVSAQNGQVIQTKQSVLGKALNKLAP
jgi:hypothetical protein